MTDKVVFRLKRHWNINGRKVDLWEEILSGRKTSEWRKAYPYWLSRLCDHDAPTIAALNSRIRRMFIPKIDLSRYLKVKKAWFTIGYPKQNLPRIEAYITALYYHKPLLSKGRLEIQFKVTEIMKG